jgi:elongation factor P--(R)-beta-lysine ligase
MLADTRKFFAGRDVLEVETPLVLRHTVTDAQLASFELVGAPPRYLHTSPEYAMKRLLAAGSGDIYQVCKVFRADEVSPSHNPEFTMVEWYRLGFDLQAIMVETTALIANLLGGDELACLPVETLSYAEAFRRELGLDPMEASAAELTRLACDLSLAPAGTATYSRDDLLDFLITARVGPALGHKGLTCLHHYPASQAALAQIDPVDTRTALRFEIYGRGMELANGFVELANPGEQRRRFEADIAERARRALPRPAIDEPLIAALEAGLPPCAGVAVGFDRVLMLALGARRIDEVLSFGWNSA